MFKRNSLTRFNIYLSLFAILLVTICPVITQTIALLAQSSSNTSHHAPSLSHFECASQFYKENHLNPADFIEEHKAEPIFGKHNPVKETHAEHDGIVNCGYCDLLHTASILVAFYVTVFNPPSSELVIISSEPYISSLNYWSIRSRAPPTLTASV